MGDELPLRKGPTLSVPNGVTVHSVAAHPRRTSPHGVVVFFHGMWMHARCVRYSRLYTSLQAKGLLVVAWDCPHHGMSSRLGTKGHPLRTLDMHESSIVSYACLFVAEVRKRYGPTLPLVMIGESMGGGIALRVAHHVKPAGVVTLCGMVQTPLFQLGPVWGGILGLARLIRSSIRAGVETATVPTTKDDPLVSRQILPYSAVRCQFDIVRRTRYDLLSFPLFCVVGSDDSLFSEADTRRMLDRCSSSPDKHLLVLDGADHNLVATVDAACDAAADFALRCCEVWFDHRASSSAKRRRK